VDALVSRTLGRGLRAFVAAENLLDAALVVARSPVATVAPPRTLRAGLRLTR
jgi:outer membrane receptor protein involved in Fe transport